MPVSQIELGVERLRSADERDLRDETSLSAAEVKAVEEFEKLGEDIAGGVASDKLAHRQRVPLVAKELHTRETSLFPVSLEKYSASVSSSSP